MRMPVERPRLTAILALPRVSGIMLRRLPSEPRLLLLVAVVCATTFILAVTPRYLVQVSDDGIQQAVGSVPAHQSSVSVVVEQRVGISRNAASFAELDKRGVDYHAELPETVRAVTSYQNYVSETPDLTLINGHGQPLYNSLLQYVYVSFRFQSGVWEHITLLEGRQPQAREPMWASEAINAPVDFDALTPLIEIVLSETAADVMHAELGQRFLVVVNEGSPLIPVSPPGASGARQRLLIEISGIIAINDLDDPYWLGDLKLHEPGRSKAGEPIYYFPAVLPAEDETVLGDLYRATLGSTINPRNWRYTWNYPAQPAEFYSDTAPELARELRRLESTGGPVELLAGRNTDAFIRSSLPGIIETYAAQQRVFTTMLALAAAGLLALSLVLAALLATLLVERRRAAFALLQGRGASATQLIVSQAIESAIVIVPATAIGLLLAVLLVDAGTLHQPRIIAVAVCLSVATLLIATAYTRLIKPPLRTIDRPPPDLGRRSPQRLVIEIAVIIMALLGALLLRRRGIESGVSEERSGLLGVDPYLALTPVLLGLAVGLLSARALPVIAGMLARWLARRRGLVGLMALRRIGRATGESNLPLIALLLAIAISGFSLIVADSINHGQREAAMLTTGADYRIESASGFDLLPDDLDLDAIPGVESFAQLAVTPGVTARTSSRVPDRIALVVLEPQAYRQVIDGTPLEGVYNEPLAALSGGPRDGAIPALVSPGWADRRDLMIGDTFVMAFGSQDVLTVVQGIGSAPPGVTAGVFFAIAAYDDLRETATAFSEFRPTHAYLRADPDAQRLREALLAELDGATQLVSRIDLYEQRRASPLTGGVATGFRLTVIIATVFATVASIASLVISARERGRDLGFLRTMGLTQRQALRLVIAETVPMVLAAAVIGGLLGIATAWVIEPGFDLSPFSGSAAGQTSLQLNLPGIIVISAAITVVVLLCTALFVLLTRRDQLGQLLRVGDE